MCSVKPEMQYSTCTVRKDMLSVCASWLHMKSLNIGWIFIAMKLRILSTMSSLSHQKAYISSEGRQESIKKTVKKPRGKYKSLTIAEKLEI